MYSQDRVGGPRFDIDKLAIVLFGMGFDQGFINVCRTGYHWNFKALLPSLYDGTFYGDRFRGHPTGQEHLMGFATFLSGAFAQYEIHRIPLNEHFEQSLLKDGYRFDRGSQRLVQVGLDTLASPELAQLPDRASLVRDISSVLEGEGCAVAFIDLDDFKPVNDRLSHAQGDECLATIVRAICGVLRQKGKLYRVGGDEFCAALPNFTIEEALATAERVRHAIDDLPPFGNQVKVTASIGVAASHGKTPLSAERLVKEADDAMYVSKFTTKNRVSGWPPDPTEAAQAEANRRRSDRQSAVGS